MSSGSSSRTLKRADPSTIQDKFLVGYQGWFTCPGDGPPLDPHHHGWLHWFSHPVTDGGRPNVDIWPDVSEYSPSELFPASGLKTSSGEQVFLFSSRNQRTVERHFHWMALHGVDGAFLQRFVGQCDVEGGHNRAIREQRDEVGDLVRQAAEKEGRVFAMMYDVAGVPPDRIQRVLEHDWIHLLRKRGILDSPNYLKEKGKPVVALWGFGMGHAGHNPATVRAVTDFIRNNTPGGAYIIGGGPAYWRTSTDDADRNPEFVDVWLECFDAISPWTIGRYSNTEEADRFADWNVKGDLELIKKRNEEADTRVSGRRHIDYMPVVFPGGSGFNLSEGKWRWNDAPRKGGQFLWRQIWNLRRQGVRTIYGAMWDEYDEGTAFMPVVAKKRLLPVHEKYNFMALDEDGWDLPPDWYMRVAGFAAESLRGERRVHETFPSKELQDYWSSRPKYEDVPEAGCSGSNSKEKGQSWEEWEKDQKTKGGPDELPPPPYSLEAEESVESTSSVQPAVAGVPGRLGPSSVGSQSRPITPLTSRPTSAQAAAPVIPISSRPQEQSEPSTAVSALAEDFSRQTISSTSPPSVALPVQHSSRPVSPQTKPQNISPNPAFPAFPFAQPPFAPSPFGNPSGAFPMPGFSPALVGQHDYYPSPYVHTPAPAPASGPWSQTPWPPPEWGVQPPSQHSGTPSHSPYPDYRPGYQPSYNTNTSPPPTLRPRPSQSHSYTSQAESYPHSHSSSPQPSPYGPPDHGLGGFNFPSAQTNYYPGPSQSQHQGFSDPGGQSFPGQFPGQNTSPYPTSPALQAPPTSYGGYPSPSGSYPQSDSAGGSSSQALARPPSHPTSGISGLSSLSVPRPGQPGNMLENALNVIGSATGQSTKIQSLAQTGGKLFGKLTGQKK